MEKKIILETGIHTNEKILNNLKQNEKKLDNSVILSKFLNKLELNKELNAFHELACFYDKVKIFGDMNKLIKTTFILDLTYKGNKSPYKHKGAVDVLEVITLIICKDVGRNKKIKTRKETFTKRRKH